MKLQDATTLASDAKDREAILDATKQSERASQSTLMTAASVPLTPKPGSNTRTALSLGAGLSRELKDGMFVLVNHDAAVYEFESIPKPGVFGINLEAVRLSAPEVPYKITSVCQTHGDPTGLLIETTSPFDKRKVFIIACQGKVAYVHIPDEAAEKIFNEELNTRGKYNSRSKGGTSQRPKDGCQP